MSDFRQLGQSLRQAQDDWTALDAKYRAVKPRPMPDSKPSWGVGFIIGGILAVAVWIFLGVTLLRAAEKAAADVVAAEWMERG